MKQTTLNFLSSHSLSIITGFLAGMVFIAGMSNISSLETKDYWQTVGSLSAGFGTLAILAFGWIKANEWKKQQLFIEKRQALFEWHDSYLAFIAFLENELLEIANQYPNLVNNANEAELAYIEAYKDKSNSKLRLKIYKKKLFKQINIRNKAFDDFMDLKRRAVQERNKLRPYKVKLSSHEQKLYKELTQLEQFSEHSGSYLKPNQILEEPALLASRIREIHAQADKLLYANLSKLK